MFSTPTPRHPGTLPKVRSSVGMKAVLGRLGQWAGGRVYRWAHQLSHDARPHESSLETHPTHLDPLAPTGMRWGWAVRQDRPWWPRGKGELVTSGVSDLSWLCHRT